MNDAIIGLSKDDCYCGITEFYDKVAEKLGYEAGTVRYDCMKICVSKPVQDEIYAYYQNVRQAALYDINVAWVKYGPKANLPHNTYTVSIQDGFICEEG